MPLKHTVHKVTTNDGVEGLVIDVPGTPVVHYELHFRAGYHSTPASMPQQTAHVLEHILYGWVDDDRYPTKKDYANDVFRNGAYANATTYYAGSWGWGDNDFDEWQRIIGLRRLALTKPLLAAAPLKAEKGNAEDELRSNIGNYERLASEISRQNLGFVSETSMQKKDSIKNVTLQAAQELYACAYTRANMRFVIAGDFNGRPGTVTDTFSGWELPEGRQLDFTPVTLRKGGAINFVRVNDLPNIYFVMTFAVQRRLEGREKRALELLNDRLFNVQNARVFEEARRRGICYRMNARVDLDVPTVSLWTIAFPIAPENMREMITLLLDALKGLVKDGLGTDEFETGLRYVKGRFVQKGQTASTISDLYSDEFFYSGYVDMVAAEDAYEKVDTQLINNLVREFLTSESWTVAGVGKVGEKEFKSSSEELMDFLKANKLKS